MVTRRERYRGSIAHVALIGALALTVLFGALGVDSIAATAHGTEPHRPVIMARETKASVVAAGSTRARGSAWVASLIAAVGCAALAAQLIDSDRRGRARRLFHPFSIRLRAPPHLHVAH